MKCRAILLAASLFAAVPPAFGLGPHEVLLVINGKSPESVQIGKNYAAIRKIPESNIVRISVPAVDGAIPVGMTPPQFESLIWKPVNREIGRRGIGDHILAWVYSAGFPVRIDMPGYPSLTAMTFHRGKLPEHSTIRDGTYVSPLYDGMGLAKKKTRPSQTFDVAKIWLEAEMPLPSMMLGYAGERGNSTDTIVDYLSKGALSDGTYPVGTVYFLTNSDIRSECRQWQFAPAVLELKSMKVHAVVTNALDPGNADVLGLMTGTAICNPPANNYLPGCMADHLTSTAADYGGSGQTKISVWFDAGATASAGGVSEPLAQWVKFPSARFYVHYRSGCTMIESFYQSLACPAQILVVGEPLARPWSPPARLSMGLLPEGPFSGEVVLTPSVTCKGAVFSEFVCLVDGRKMAVGKTPALDTTELKNGKHTLRVVGYSTGLVRHQVFAEKTIVVKNR